MFGDLSFSHILILLLIFVLVFGARRIPEIGASLGQGIKEFKKSLREVTDERSDQRNFQAPPPASGVPPTSGGEPKRLSQ
jgi:sec-independent protein translocase protein TatA